MSFEFEEPKINYRTIDISSAVTHNTPFLVRHGFIKDLQTAKQLMYIVSIVSILGSVYLFVFRPFSPEVKYREDFSASEIERMLPDMERGLPSKPK